MAPLRFYGDADRIAVFCRGRIYAILAAERIAGYVITYRIRP